MATASETKATRRDFLYIATGAVGAVGVAGAAWPLINQLNPDASVLALASIRFDVAPVAEGSSVTIMWRGLPVFVRHRTPAEIDVQELRRQQLERGVYLRNPDGTRAPAAEHAPAA